MSKIKLLLIVAATSFVDEKGVLRQAGDHVEVSEKYLKEQLEVAEKFNLPKHEVLVEDVEAQRAAEEKAAAEATAAAEAQRAAEEKAATEAAAAAKKEAAEAAAAAKKEAAAAATAAKKEAASAEKDGAEGL